MRDTIIVMLKPEFVLIEQLVALAFEPEINRVGFRDGTVSINDEDRENLESFIEGSNYEDFKKISIKYNLKLIGCDLSEGELCGYSRDDERIYDDREKKMGEV